jgi:hypothetical protein
MAFSERDVRGCTRQVRPDQPAVCKKDPEECFNTGRGASADRPAGLYDGPTATDPRRGSTVETKHRPYAYILLDGNGIPSVKSLHTYTKEAK